MPEICAKAKSVPYAFKEEQKVFEFPQSWSRTCSKIQNLVLSEPVASYFCTQGNNKEIRGALTEARGVIRDGMVNNWGDIERNMGQSEMGGSEKGGHKEKWGHNQQRGSQKLGRH